MFRIRKWRFFRKFGSLTPNRRKLKEREPGLRCKILLAEVRSFFKKKGIDLELTLRCMISSEAYKYYV